jgi:hypothetical protein
MKSLWMHRPSPAMIVALIALVVAMSGTAVAATTLVNGDKLIAKHTLSGNRLRNHTVTAQQIQKVKWHPLTLENGWVTYATNGAGFGSTPQYTKDAQGFVHLRGAIDGSAQTSTAFATLPVGFRPPNGAWVAVGSSNNAFNPYEVNVYIAADGTMEVANNPGANDAFVSLEGAVFYPGP